MNLGDIFCVCFLLEICVFGDFICIMDFCKYLV